MNYRKYKNTKVEYNGMKFDSKKELNRYLELNMLVNAGQLKYVLRQVRFEVIPKTETERNASYVADFVYEDASGKKFIEDVKSPMTRQLSDYILKRKLIKWRYPDYTFIEYV